MLPPGNDPVVLELLRLRADVDALLKREYPNQALDTISNVTLGSLNVGSASGAATGDERLSGTLWPGPAAGTGATGVASARHVLAAAGIDQLASGNGFGTVFLHDQSNGATAIYVIRGGVHLTKEISDPTGTFTETAGSATSINVYWNGVSGHYEIQNTNAGSHTVDVVMLGTL